MQLVRIDKGDGSKGIVENVSATITRIAGHHQMTESWVNDVLHRDGRIQTDFCIYEVVKEPITVKVRVAVAVDKEGKWSASGWSQYNDKDTAMDVAIEGVDEGEARYWITAELPIPKDTEAIEIAAEVEPSDND